MNEKVEQLRPHLSPAQAAERYKVGLCTIYNWDRYGIMPASVKLSRKRLWWLADLQEWEDAGFPSQTRNEEKVEA